MRYERLHRKVFLWWTDYFAVQFVAVPEFSIGIHLEPARPLLDIFIGPLTIAFGKHPALTDPRTRERHSCRGFLIGDAYERMVF